MKRLYVPQTLPDEVVDVLSEKVGAMSVGDSVDTNGAESGRRTGPGVLRVSPISRSFIRRGEPHATARGHQHENGPESRHEGLWSLAVNRCVTRTFILDARPADIGDSPCSPPWTKGLWRWFGRWLGEPVEARFGAPAGPSVGVPCLPCGCERRSCFD